MLILRREPGSVAVSISQVLNLLLKAVVLEEQMNKTNKTQLL